jgi:hypothetical protein
MALESDGAEFEPEMAPQPEREREREAGQLYTDCVDESGRPEAAGKEFLDDTSKNFPQLLLGRSHPQSGQRAQSGR